MVLKQFMRRPEIIEAIQYRGDVVEITSAVKQPNRVCFNEVSKELELLTNHGWAIVKHSDWVLQKEDGELYPCKDELFKKLVDETIEIPAHLPEHLKSVFIEQKQLQANIDKLIKDINTGQPLFPEKELKKMRRQKDHMENYYLELEERLNLQKCPISDPMRWPTIGNS